MLGRKYLLLNFLILNFLPMSVSFAETDLSFNSLWYDEFKPTIMESFDTNGQIIFASGFASYLAAREVDEQVYRDNVEEEDGMYMDNDTAQLFGTIGNGSYGLGVGLLQYFLDRPNGVKHLKAITLTSATHITMAYTFQRKRPNGELNFLPFHSSFPSGHAASAFATATSLSYAYGLWAAIPSYALATAICVARVNENVHWTSDVVTGAFLGIYWGRAAYNAPKEEETSWIIAPIPSGLMFTSTF